MHLWFAEDISLLGGSENCNNSLKGCMEKTAAGFGIEICSDKSKVLVSSIKPRPSTNVWMNGKVLEEVYEFKYMGSTQNTMDYH